MNTRDEIAQCYANVIGQRRVVDNRILAHSAYAMGSNEPCSVLFTGEAGLGKSHLLRAEMEARTKAAAIRFKRDGNVGFFKSPQEFRLLGGTFFDLVSILQFGDGLVVDELHEVQLRPTVQIDKFLRALKQLMDNGQGEVKTARIDDETIISRAKQDVFYACGTNYPQKIKDGPAIISRFGGETQLSPYTEEELSAILLYMTKEKGLRVHENTVGLLARCGRGTARPLESIVAHLHKLAKVEGKDTVNRGEVIQSLRDLHLYPNGVSRREIGILVSCMNNGLEISFIPIRFQCETKASQASISFLWERGFISVRQRRCFLTPRGAAYLDNLKADKFDLSC